MVKIVPILLSVVVSYVVATALGEVDFSGVAAASWVGLPIVWNNTVFALFGPQFDSGLAMILASLFGAPANTTYGENTCVLALTRVFDPRVIRIAACCVIVLSFCPKFAAVIAAMPACVIGGVTISLSGLAVGSLVGIVLNAILPGNDFELDVSELEEDVE